MRWGWLLMVFMLCLTSTGCSSLRKRKRQGGYEQIKQEKIEGHKQEIKRLNPKEPSQLY
jgi:uncharacterized protein YceK